jgi:very-short-patch-repair endonuclease
MYGVKKHCLLRKPKKHKRRLSSVDLARKRMNQSKASIYGQKLLNNPTAAEKIMIEILQHHNVVFDFQKQVFDKDHCYIVDFYLRRNGDPLVIEIDGLSHKHSKGYDMIRTEWLKKRRHCEVIRFTNEQVIHHPEEVALNILMREVRFKVEGCPETFEMVGE